MSYGDTRYLYNNLLDSATLTPGSQATGIVTGAEKTIGTDEGLMFALGAYSHTADLQYIVQIDSVSAGTAVGQATFRWRTTDTAVGTWEASGVTTSTSLTLLNYGVYVAFRAGTSGVDFAVEDTFIFYASAIYGTPKLLDRYRGTVFRSAATFPFVIDLGSAKNVTAFALLDHNLTAGVSTLTLQANSSDSWGSPAYSQALTITDPLVYYLDQTYRYWRTVPVDGALSYWEASNMFLGTYLQLSRMPNWGASRMYGYSGFQNVSDSGVARQRVYAKKAGLSLSYDLLSNADFTLLHTMQDTLVDTSTGLISPLWVHLFYDETDTAFLMHWTNIMQWERTYFRLGLNTATMEFEEVLQTRI